MCCYFSLLVAYIKVMKAQSQKRVIKMEWHPYPEEKPKKTSNCILSLSCEGTDLTATSWWDNKEKQFESYWDSIITAWAYMPRPYKKKV